MDKPSVGGSQPASAPAQPSSKSAAAAPKLSNEVELGHLPGDGTAPELDIMQLARIGDVAAMEKLFELGDYDATYSDDEGITPLHVRCQFLIPFWGMHLEWVLSLMRLPTVGRHQQSICHVQVSHRQWSRDQ
jgi:hypothetical protein